MKNCKPRRKIVHSDFCVRVQNCNLSCNGGGSGNRSGSRSGSSSGNVVSGYHLTLSRHAQAVHEEKRTLE